MRLETLDKETAPGFRELVLDRIAGIDAAVFGSSSWGRKAFADNVSNDYDYLVAAVERPEDVPGTKFSEGGYAAEKNSSVLSVHGYGLLRCFDDAEIIMIATDPARRREGIGKLLLGDLIEEARRRKAGCIFLEVRETNFPARAMYRGAGFTEEGVRRGYYHDPPENAVIMRYLC
ncbi:MAG: ribosomal protein S18-alanine N-acetyltransferase [Clostridiales bacterium]|nr:ribosomal protein S18-alanine N-acetyltransferase [Clostridiales bacterium]